MILVHPFLVISCSFTNQVLSQLDTRKKWKETKAFKKDAYLHPKELDKKATCLHPSALGAELTTLTKQELQVVTMDDVVGDIDLFTSTTGDFDIITVEHIENVINNAMLSNIGHCANKIDMAGLEKLQLQSIKVKNIKPQVGCFVWAVLPGILTCYVLLLHQPGTHPA